VKGIEFRRAQRIAIAVTLGYAVVLFFAPVLFNPFEPTGPSRFVGLTFKFPAIWLIEMETNVYLVLIVHFVFWATLIFTFSLAIQVLVRKAGARRVKR
jgi:hypothetical protein